MIVYKLTAPSGKSYVGITTTTVEERFKQHQNQPSGKKLEYAFNKYPPETWTTTILDKASTQKELHEKEIMWISKLGTIANGYNTHIGGWSGAAGTTLSEEHKTALSDSRKQYFKSEEGLLRKKQLSTRWLKNNPSELRKGKPGRKQTEETKEKLSKIKKGKKLNLSAEQRQNHRDKMKKLWAGGVFDNRPRPSKETIERSANSRRGFKQSDHQKAVVAKANSKTWEVTTPDGDVLIIENLTKFCRENPCDQANLSRHGKSKGYTAHKL